MTNLASKFNFVNESIVLVSLLHGFSLNFEAQVAPTQLQIDILTFSYGNFYFYFNNTIPLNKENCAREFFVGSPFTNVLSLYFSKMYYSTNVCPYVFLDSTVSEVRFSDISDSLIYKNRLEFLRLNASDLTIRSLSTLVVQVEYIVINDKIISKDLFSHVQLISLCGYIYDIQSDVFASFKNLKMIIIQSDSVEMLLSKGLKWLGVLNTDIDLSKESSYVLSRAIYITIIENENPFKQPYTYPDRDLCLFKRFPHRRLIYPILETPARIKCTCTFIWLIHFSEFYLTPDYTSFYENVKVPLKYVQHCLSTKNMSDYIKDCNFVDRFKSCHDNQPIRSILLSNTNIKYAYKWIQYLVEVYYQPIFAAIGLVTNSLTILVIVSKKDPHLTKNFCNVMYKHILANSAFNIVYCVIKLLSLVNICIFPRSSFCSHIYKTEFSQYLKIYVFYFFGNATRLCYNISFIMFTISRYCVSTSNKSKAFKKFENMNASIFYLLIILLCLSFSSFKVFQYNVNRFSIDIDANYPFDAYSVSYCGKVFDEQLKNRTSLVVGKCRGFTALNVVNIVLNNVVFFFICICADICLVIFTKKNVRNKKSMFPSADNIILAHAVSFQKKSTRWSSPMVYSIWCRMRLSL